ncbi:hypothetical protein SEA_MUFASA8_65 [Arthrobacter phage Mufasa8]|uniref:Uncharacterized protein n=1 Tax=Arthrobacter phage Mufasa8 TaxID=2656526 RepID=A0A649VPB8_9CAUD|nr:hypothetical protein HYQ08_gp065 [Arthrobacter phage Mufasa8]QGJ93513.1 hypothetical protein SEA_MUFASA8_65 [Arthrobacter phage Mufasa8]
MSRRADAPQTTNADTPRAAELRRAAKVCVTANHGPFHPEDCPLKQAIPDGSVPHPFSTTAEAIKAITGKGLDSTKPAYLRSQLRRWAIKEGN